MLKKSFVVNKNYELNIAKKIRAKVENATMATKKSVSVVTGSLSSNPPMNIVGFNISSIFHEKYLFQWFQMKFYHPNEHYTTVYANN